MKGPLVAIRVDVPPHFRQRESPTVGHRWRRVTPRVAHSCATLSDFIRGGVFAAPFDVTSLPSPIAAENSRIDIGDCPALARSGCATFHARPARFKVCGILRRSAEGSSAPAWPENLLIWRIRRGTPLLGPAAGGHFCNNFVPKCHACGSVCANDCAYPVDNFHAACRLPVS